MSCFIYFYAQYHYAEWHYAECCYAECCYAECHYAECRDAKLEVNAYEPFASAVKPNAFFIESIIAGIF